MVLERLKEYIDSKGISVAAFEKSVGLANSSFRKALATGKGIGSDKLENILTCYPDISAEWLLRGTGTDGETPDCSVEAFRRLNDLSQEDLASYLAVSTSFIQKVEENGQKLPDVQLDKLMRNHRGWDTTPLFKRKECGVIQTIGSGSNNNTQVAGRSNEFPLEEKVKLLEKIIDDKERTIKLLMGGRH